MLGKEDTFGINGSFGAPGKNFSINFSKAKTNFAWGCITMMIIVKRKKSISSKQITKMLTFPLRFV